MEYTKTDKYRTYQNEYAKRALVRVNVKLHKQKDSDIIEAIGDNRAGNIKRLVRMGMGVKEVQ